MTSGLVDISSQLAAQLAVHIENAVDSFCFMKGISRGEISKDDYCKALGEVARNLCFDVGEAAKFGTPREIISRLLNRCGK